MNPGDLYKYAISLKNLRRIAKPSAHKRVFRMGETASRPGVSRRGAPVAMTFTPGRPPPGMEDSPVMVGLLGGGKTKFRTGDIGVGGQVSELFRELMPKGFKPTALDKEVLNRTGLMHELFERSSQEVGSCREARVRFGSSVSR